MSVSAKSQVNSIRQATADGEITPTKLADTLDAILTEAKSEAQFTIPDYLEEERIDAIAQTANSALQAAAGTEIENPTYSEIQLCQLLGIPYKAMITPAPGFEPWA